MLVAGARTRQETSGRVVGLRVRWDEGCFHTLLISAEGLNMLFTEWKGVLHLHELALPLPVECNSIPWPDLSGLRVLRLGITGRIRGRKNWRLDTLLPHLSLESLTITPYGVDDSLVCEDCVAIGNHIASTKYLKELSLDDDCESSGSTGVDDEGMEAITRALAGNQSLPLERLELMCWCTFTDTAADCLAQFITNTTSLQYLTMRWCTFSAHGLQELARAIHHNSTLQEKSLEDLRCTVDGDHEAEDFAQLLVDYPDMVCSMDWEIKAHGEMFTNISDAGAVALAQAFHHNTTLWWLNLSNNSISDAGAVALAQALHHNSTLLWLYLSNNSVSDAGAVALAQALHHNSTLRELDLSNNSISDAGAVALAQALHNSTLRELDLSNNSISDAGAVALAQALHHNSTLWWLDLSNNSISAAGAVALAQVLHHNSTLWWLDLSNNSISGAGAVALAQALHHNSTLRWLVLSNNSVSDAGAVAPAQALHHNSTLQELDLSNNSISDAGAVALAQALHHNSTLRELDLSNNSISDAGVSVMLEQ